jgi:hypothetical protein
MTDLNHVYPVIKQNAETSMHVGQGELSIFSDRVASVHSKGHLLRLLPLSSNLNPSILKINVKPGGTNSRELSVIRVVVPTMV